MQTFHIILSHVLIINVYIVTYSITINQCFHGLADIEKITIASDSDELLVFFFRFRRKMLAGGGQTLQQELLRRIISCVQLLTAKLTIPSSFEIACWIFHIAEELRIKNWHGTCFLRVKDPEEKERRNGGQKWEEENLFEAVCGVSVLWWGIGIRRERQVGWNEREREVGKSLKQRNSGR